MKSGVRSDAIGDNPFDRPGSCAGALPRQTSWNNGYNRIDDCKSGKESGGRVPSAKVHRSKPLGSAPPTGRSIRLVAGAKKCRPKGRLREQGRDLIFVSMARVVSCPVKSPMTYSSVWLRLLSSGRITNRCPLLQQYTTLSASRKFHWSNRSGISRGCTVSSSDSQTAHRLGWSMPQA